jgi:hypothetical protein
MDNAEKKEKTKKEAFLERFSQRNPDLKIDDEDAYYDAIMRFMDEFEGYEERSKAFLERFSQRNPDLKIDDEDAYYDAVMRYMDEFEEYEERSNRLRENIEKSPAYAEMVIASRGKDNFDPVIWLVESGQLDLDALQSDPDYNKKLADARAAYLDKLTSSKKLKEEQEKNMPASVEAIRVKAEEMGIDDKTTEEIVGKMYELMDDMIRGVLPLDVFEMLYKGSISDKAVEEARAEGVAEGLNKKVDDKLRQMPAPSAPAGRQTPVPEDKPRPVKNPFLA